MMVGAKRCQATKQGTIIPVRSYFTLFHPPAYFTKSHTKSSICTRDKYSKGERRPLTKVEDVEEADIPSLFGSG